MPAPDKLLMTLRQAIVAFRSTPGRIGRFTQIPAGDDVLVAGDMHGSVENLRLLLKKADLAQHPRRHLVVQEVIHGPFNYAQGGDKSHQMLDLIAALKCQYPERVHFLLGNHELAQWQDQRIGKGDADLNESFVDGVRVAYKEHSEAVYGCYRRLIESADLALRTVNRVFLCHTIVPAKYLAAFELSILLRDDLSPEDLKLGGAVHSLVWGRDLAQKTVEAFLHKVDADWVLTGHIPCDEGFMVPNTRQIVLDAKGYPACYCHFPTDRPVTQEELIASVGIL